MLVKDFITKEIPVLKSFDTAEYALALMEDFKLKHLPLLSDSAVFSVGKRLIGAAGSFGYDR